MLLCHGAVNGHAVGDIQLDTGCSRTVVRSDLVDEKRILEGEHIPIQCAHGDVVSYPQRYRYQLGEDALW